MTATLLDVGCTLAIRGGEGWAKYENPLDALSMEV